MNGTFVRLGIMAACGAAVVVTAGCAKKTPPARPPAVVQTALAIQTNAPIIIDAFGYTEDRVSVDVVPQVSGTLVKSLMADGAVVTNGQPLFLIDSSDYEARVRQVEGMVMADRANVQLNKSTLERSKALFEKKLISTTAFDTLQARADASEGQLQMDEALLDQARLNLSRCTVTASIAGVCSKRYVDDGNLVAAGLTRLTNIRSYDPMDLEFSVSEQYVPVLRQSMAEGTARVDVVPRGSTIRYPGVLTFIDNAVNPQGGTILLRGQVPNPELKLWAKQFVDVTIIAGSIQDAVMVPESAVQFGKQGTYLYAVKDDKADLRLVKMGIRVGRWLQILEGVKAGEKVVVLGQLMLQPGSPVAEAAAPAGNGAPQGPAAGAPAGATASGGKK